MLQPLKQARRTLTEYFGQLILTNYARGHLPLTVDQAVLREITHSPRIGFLSVSRLFSNTGTDWSDLDGKQSRLARALGTAVVCSQVHS
jgi:hypothetical protein